MKSVVAAHGKFDAIANWRKEKQELGRHQQKLNSTEKNLYNVNHTLHLMNLISKL